MPAVVVTEQPAIEPGLIFAARRFPWVVVGCALALVLGTIAFQATREPVEVATTTIMLRAPGGSEGGESLAALTSGFSRAPASAGERERFLTDQVEVIRSMRVMTTAAEMGRAGLPRAEWDPLAMREKTTVATASGSDAIRITFRGLDREKVKMGADVVAGAYREVARANSLATVEAAQRRVDADTDALNADRKRILDRAAVTFSGGELTVLAKELDLNLARQAELQARRDLIPPSSEVPDGVEVLVPAEFRPTPQGGLRVLVGAGIFGLFLGMGLAYLLALRDFRLSPSASVTRRAPAAD